MGPFRDPIPPPAPNKLTDRSDEAVLYRLSNLWTRAIIGIIGIVLPFIFIIGETFFLRGGVHVRGSISAYYHTSMRDVFVAGLCVIGFFLITYMSGQTKTFDFWLSLVAGVAVLIVVFFPTMRPHLLADAPRCGTTPMPQGCSPFQQQFGETWVARVHFISAAVFILSLAAMCFFVFAKGEKDHKNSPRMAAIVRLCGWLILGAVAWAIVGKVLKVTVWELTPLYLAEVVSVWAFAAAWILKARDLRKALARPQRDRRPASDDHHLLATE